VRRKEGIEARATPGPPGAPLLGRDPPSLSKRLRAASRLGAAAGFVGNPREKGDGGSGLPEELTRENSCFETGRGNDALAGDLRVAAGTDRGPLGPQAEPRLGAPRAPTALLLRLPRARPRRGTVVPREIRPRSRGVLLRPPPHGQAPHEGERRPRGGALDRRRRRPHPAGGAPSPRRS
jgi:hypothetical protein